MTKRPTSKDEEYSFCESVTECPNLPKENIHKKKRLKADLQNRKYYQQTTN